MIEKYVFPGQRVELKAVNLKEGEKNKTHNTKVYDVVGEDRIEIIMPMEQTKLILLPVDGEYDLFFYSGAVLYECVARVIDRYKSNNVYILLMELETNLRKFQRREYYRYSCALEMDSRNICEEEIANEERNEYALVPGLPLKRSIIVDISGGGLRFVS
ncbi:MAG: flagellar brake protein, partial [Lachnospiraceae bacterium]